MKKRNFLLSFLAGLLVLNAVPALALEKFKQAEFRGWRDEASNPGFHALMEGKKDFGQIKVPMDFEYGKVMTAEAGISMEFSPGLVLHIKVDELTRDTTLEVEVMESNPPYTGIKVIKEISDPGEYSVNLHEATGWDGERSFWVAIWLFGTGAEAKVSNLQIGEGIKIVNKATPGAGRRVREEKKIFGKGLKESKDDFRPDKEKNYAYFEDWSKGLNGWQDDTIKKGLDSIADIQGKGKMVLKVKKKVAYGLFVSPPKPFVVNFNTYPFLEMEVGQALEEGKVRVRLVNSRNPDEFRVITPKVERADVYMVNIPDHTGWREEKSFYLEIMLEGEDAELALNSIGFSKKMATMQGIIVQQQTLQPLALAPMKTLDALNLSVFSDQSYRGQYLDGVAKDSENWRDLNRWGVPLRDVGYSEIKQLFYLNSYLRPADGIEAWLGIGYDITNELNGVDWEEPGGRYMDARLDFGLLHYYDLYVGNVSQIGSVYDPLFTDLTFKKDYKFRGLLWKPKIAEWQFKFLGTRLSTSSSNYHRDNVFLTGVRAMKGFTFSGIGSVQFGVSALNMSKTNGNLDENLFIGPGEPPEVYQTYVPSIYIRINNNTSTVDDSTYSHLYYRTTDINYLQINNTAGLPIVASFSPTVDGEIPYLHTSSNTYQDPMTTDPNNTAVGINEGGHIILRVPLLLNQGLGTGGRVNPSQIQSITMNCYISSWSMADEGSVDFQISTDGETWTTMQSIDIFTSESPLVSGSFALPGNQLAQLKEGKFKDEGTMARSILGIDLKGQLFGVNIKGEAATSIAHNQTYTGVRTNRFAPAGYVTLSQGVEGALLKATYFNMSADYSTSFSGFDLVDDNDNQSVINDIDAEKSGVIFGDYYNIGQPVAEYTHDLYIPRDYLFDERSDRNHNGLMDNRENDHEPDYPYRRNQRGVEASVTIPRQVLSGFYLSNMEIGLYGHRVERLTQPGRNESLAASLSYRNTDLDDLDFTVGVYGARIRDDISDQYELYNAKDEDPALDEIAITNEYEDNLVVTPEFKLQYKPSWGLQGTLVDRFRYNKQLFAEREQYIGNMCAVDMRYKHYLVDSLATEPVYAGRFGTRQANASAPIHNTYYLPQEFGLQEYQDVSIFHGFYLKNSLTIINEYQLAIDLGREISYLAKHGKPEEIRDILVVGIMRDLPRGKVRIRYELTKVYFPYANALNWGQGAVWAKLELAF
ncbi:hypothetical protein JW933_05015 [candidate division FCPU426 bacterium]|nr:hypothetical protein [candidate division FCPU426 bacterium]